MSSWIDVSVPIREGMHEWPGDRPLRIRTEYDVEKGDAYSLSRATMTWHVGTHMDAPGHFVAGGSRIDAFPPEAGVGRARVIAIRGREITARELGAHRIRTGERLLFKTRNSTKAWAGAGFTRDFVSFSPDGAQFLADRRVRLVAIDYLSVDPFDADGMPAHKALLGAGVWVVEGVNLARVQAGPCDLICLPLRIVGGDGSPCRVLVRRRSARART